ncbi:MAG: alpha/beta fold hydrolase [Ignavibacteriales bacterium]|nr:alpha/beta fold hydrolase [Ignavibacteriales bacterium]
MTFYNKRKLSILVLLLIFANCLLSQTRTDLYIETVHKDTLDATYYVPTTPKPANGYPAILFVHGFSLSKDWDTSNCSFYSKSGYFTMCYSVRGHGKSTGGSTIMSTKERSDLADVVNFLKSLPEVDTNKIGLSGGSQGGLHGLWAIADDLPVRAVSSDVIVPHWASDMLMNGSIRRTVLLLHQSNIGVRFDPIRDTLWNYIRTDDYDAFASKFIPGRDIDTSQLNNKSIPSLRLLKWQDHYFSADDGIKSFADYGGMKKLYLGTHGHFSDVNSMESSYQHSIVSRWLDYFLKDVQNGILDEPTYTYAYSHLPMDSLGYFSWTRNQEVAYPPAGITENKFYLAPDSMLLFSTPTHSDTFTLLNNYLNPAYTFDTAYIEGFRGSRFNVLLPKKTISFTSPVLWEDIIWIGTPRVKFFVQSDYEKFPLHIQIYEVDSEGNKYFINRINYTARHWIPGESKWIEIDGIAHAHKFLKGSRIRIEITNIDKTNRKYLGDYPFVVPMLSQTGANIMVDEVHPAYIAIPMIGDPTSVVLASDFIPDRFELSQNYPNPFNPSTKINYQLPIDGWVTIDVYNVLGQEVMTLINEYKRIGKYEVGFNGEKLSSGVYFYRLIIQPFDGSRAFTKIRKMMLVK